jgi:hypothetical protein
VWRLRVARGRRRVSDAFVVIRRVGWRDRRRVENIWLLEGREKAVDEGGMQVVSVASVDCLCGHHFIYAIMVSTSFLSTGAPCSG